MGHREWNREQRGQIVAVGYTTRQPVDGCTDIDGPWVHIHTHTYIYGLWWLMGRESIGPRVLPFYRSPAPKLRRVLGGALSQVDS